MRADPARRIRIIQGQQVHRRGSDESGGKERGRAGIEFVGRRELFDAAGIEQHDFVGHGHGFDLVVGDVDHGDAQALLQRADLAPHLVAQLGVQVGKRLVHQADRGLADDGPAQCDPLALPPGQLGRLALQQPLQAQQLHRPVQPPTPFGRLELAHLEAEDDVFGHVQMRKQGIGLENHGDVAAGRRQVGDVPAADADHTLGHGLEPGDQP
jgi:hypothetical protein